MNAARRPLDRAGPSEDTVEAKLDRLIRLVQALDTRIAEVMFRLDEMDVGPGQHQSGSLGEDHAKLMNLTSRQHAVMQMILHGASNQEIADRMGVELNSAKNYVRGLAAKLGVKSRVQIAASMMEPMRSVDEAFYQVASGGLPKDWCESYSEPDPYRHLYQKRRGEADEE